MKIEINVTGIDWKELAEALRGVTTVSAPAATAAKKKKEAKKAPKKESAPQNTGDEPRLKKIEKSMDFMDIPLGGETKTTQTTKEIVDEFTHFVVDLTRTGKQTEAAIRGAIDKVQHEEPFKALGIRVKDMEPAMARQFVDRVKAILG